MEIIHPDDSARAIVRVFAQRRRASTPNTAFGETDGELGLAQHPGTGSGTSATDGESVAAPAPCSTSRRAGNAELLLQIQHDFAGSCC
jgi:hypothetical protein